MRTYARTAISVNDITGVDIRDRPTGVLISGTYGIGTINARPTGSGTRSAAHLPTAFRSQISTTSGKDTTNPVGPRLSVSEIVSPALTRRFRPSQIADALEASCPLLYTSASPGNTAATVTNETPCL